MQPSPSDPLALGQRIVAVLESGRRTATYKLATLMALIDHCIENLPDDPEEELPVPFADLAERVLEIYWRQVRPFDGEPLRQSTQPTARILREAVDLRIAVGGRDSGISLAVARLRAPVAHAQAVAHVALALAQQPVHRLQRLGDGGSTCFLYDDSWLHDHVTVRQLEEHDSRIVLFPGVAAALARLAGLLKPTLEILWVEDVRRWNRQLDERVPDIAGHLFGRERISLAPAREALMEAFGARCFYCGTVVGRSAPVDHVLPWSRLGLDGLANLVIACPRCNSDKSQRLPAPRFVEASLSRDRDVVDRLADQLSWPTQRERVVAAARGLYRGEPIGAPVWDGFRVTQPLDLSWPTDWLLRFD